MTFRALLPSVLLLATTSGAGCASTAPTEAASPVDVGAPSVALHGKRYLETRVGVHIQAPPEVVWGLLTDAAAYPTWNSTVTSLEGTIAKGETIELRSTVDPKRTFKLEVSAFDPHTHMVWQDGGRAFMGVRTFTLVALPDGSTEVTMAEVMTGSMMGMIEKKLPDFRPSFDDFARDLATAAEVQASAG